MGSVSVPACSPSAGLATMSQDRLQLSPAVREILSDIRKTREHNIQVADRAGVLLGTDQELNIRGAVTLLTDAISSGQMSLGDFRTVWESERAAQELLKKVRIPLAKNARSKITLGSSISQLDAVVEL